MNQALARGPSWIIHQVKVRPVVKDGAFFGFQITELFAGESTVRPKAIRVGDIVQRINGQPIESPDQFMGVWRGLGDAERLSVRVIRGRRPLLITWRISPDGEPAVSQADRAR